MRSEVFPDALAPLTLIITLGPTALRVLRLRLITGHERYLGKTGMGSEDDRSAYNRTPHVTAELPGY